MAIQPPLEAQRGTCKLKIQPPLKGLIRGCCSDSRRPRRRERRACTRVAAPPHRHVPEGTAENYIVRSADLDLGHEASGWDCGPRCAGSYEWPARPDRAPTAARGTWQMQAKLDGLTCLRRFWSALTGLGSRVERRTAPRNSPEAAALTFVQPTWEMSFRSCSPRSPAPRGTESTKDRTRSTQTPSSSGVCRSLSPDPLLAE